MTCSSPSEPREESRVWTGLLGQKKTTWGQVSVLQQAPTQSERTADDVTVPYDWRFHSCIVNSFIFIYVRCWVVFHRPNSYSAAEALLQLIQAVHRLVCVACVTAPSTFLGPLMYWAMCSLILSVTMPDKSAHVEQKQVISCWLGWDYPLWEYCRIRTDQPSVNHSVWVASLSSCFISFVLPGDHAVQLVSLATRCQGLVPSSSSIYTDRGLLHQTGLQTGVVCCHCLQCNCTHAH